MHLSWHLFLQAEQEASPTGGDGAGAGGAAVGGAAVVLGEKLSHVAPVGRQKHCCAPVVVIRVVGTVVLGLGRDVGGAVVVVNVTGAGVAAGAQVLPALLAMRVRGYFSPE